MKVFISWSGESSQKIAVILRDWLPCVIQSITPYVSSEDIDKGARWSSDIAKELGDSSYGILCVTKENIDAPWINFEAGALSKTFDKSMVCPFLFNLKRAEVNGPLLQFQSTIFEKEDIRKLLISLNQACGQDTLPSDRLDKLFEVLYPELEQKLKNLEIEKEKHKPKSPTKEDLTEKIIEEILEISRNNQKILIQSDSTKDVSLQEVKKMLGDVISRISYLDEKGNNRSSKKFHPMFMEDILFRNPKDTKNKYFGFLIFLSMMKSDLPWIYDEGVKLIEALKNTKPKGFRQQSINDFMELCEYSFEHPAIREFLLLNREYRYIYKELPYILRKYFDFIEGDDKHKNTIV